MAIAVSGIRQMLDEDIRAGFVDKNFTVDRVINDRILKIAQQELRAEGKLNLAGSTRALDHAERGLVRHACSGRFRHGRGLADLQPRNANEISSRAVKAVHVHIIRSEPVRKLARFRFYMARRFEQNLAVHDALREPRKRKLRRLPLALGRQHIDVTFRLAHGELESAAASHLYRQR